jgi:FkbM family methyltransferase
MKFNDNLIELPSDDDFDKDKIFTITQNDSPILIYQVGKVGSSTIYNSLKKSIFDVPIYQVHNIHTSQELYNKEQQNSYVESSHHLLLGIKLNEIIKNKKNIKWKIIIGVRDPIHRWLSDIFQNINERYSNLKNTNGTLDKSKLINYFVKSLDSNPMEKWFYDELFNTFHVDISTINLDKSKGYTICKVNGVEILFYTMESLKNSFEIMMKEFLPSHNIKMEKANEASSKDYHADYKFIQNVVKFELKYLEEYYYNNSVAKYFYSNQRLKEFIDKWKKAQIKQHKISIITPSCNSGDYIERAILSVMAQNYSNYEHIIVDNCSRDNTIDILKKYPHLIWKSEKDLGQSNAMNKGFAMSTGEIIVYLNCDDYFEPGAFDNVNYTFSKKSNTKFLIGNVYCHLLDGKVLEVKPKITYKEMIYFWTGWNNISPKTFTSSFPNNPVQYFYRREVQERIMFNEDNHFTMDLEFLINAAYKYGDDFEYVDRVLGHYVFLPNAKSIVATKKAKYWSKENFAYIDHIIKDEDFYNGYIADRERGFEEKISNLTNGQKNILVYTPVPIFPVIQGNRKRIINFVKELNKHNCNLYLVVLGENNIDSEEMKLLYDEYFIRTFQFPRNKDHSTLFKRNITVDEAYEEGLGEFISDICIKFNINIYLHNYIFQSKVFDYIPPKILKVLDTHDKFKDKYKVAKWYSYSQEAESIAVSRADLILAIKAQEQRYFQSITEKIVLTIGHIQEPKFLKKDYSSFNKIGIISSGHYNDLLSVEKFISSFLKCESLSIELHIAGQICADLTSKFKSSKIKYLWMVDELKDFYNNIDLCVIPPEQGTGLKIKAIEALSYGVPILSTAHGFEGISSTHRYHNAPSCESLIHYLNEIKENQQLLNTLKFTSERVYEKYFKNNQENFRKILSNNVNDIIKKTSKFNNTSITTKVFSILNKRGLLNNLNTDESIKKLIGKIVKKNNNVIDVGVNHGQFLYYFSDLVGTKGSVYGFEPNPRCFNLNMQKIKEGQRTNITLFQNALADSDYYSEFTIFNGAEGYSGLKERIINNPKINKSDKTVIQVKVKNLDSYITKLKNISLIKLDTEGSELLILNGSIKILKRDKPVIIFEHGYQGASVYGYDYKDLFGFLSKYDYSIYLSNGIRVKNLAEFREINKTIYNFIAIHNTSFESLHTMVNCYKDYITELSCKTIGSNSSLVSVE